MSIESIRSFITEKAVEFGARDKSYTERKNVDKSFEENGSGAYLGFVQSGEENKGPYSDFSFIIFPSDKECTKLVVTLCVGSLGFKNDYGLATYPGLRRLYQKIINDMGYCKTDFSDIETVLPKKYIDKLDSPYLKNTIDKYRTVMPACQIVEDPESEHGKQMIAAFLAGYAKLREWPSNQLHRKAISKALLPFESKSQVDNDTELIKSLLQQRKYVVLQGPPGTGKTRTAKHVAKELQAKTFFTQFHAETSYSDFIYGIRPDIKSKELSYVEELGVFIKALKAAIDSENNENVILIIDEINRANLSNVLGPVFYLFEHKMEDSDVSIEITPELKISKLPENFHVIATMNTADRSLAVVDFALRRRFAWFNKMPKEIKGKKKGKLVEISTNKTEKQEYFFKEDFAVIEEIFNWYASSNELNLQPGEGYFIAQNEEEMHFRIQYEIYPLIKEYLQEGLLRNAREEFNNYFTARINQSLFE